MSDPVLPTPDQPPTSPSTATSGRRNSEDRKELLGRAIQSQLAQGKRRIETRGDYDAVVVKQKNVNIGTGANILLTLVTFGLWLLVWVILAVADKEHRFMLQVDEFGNTTVSELT